MNNLINENLKYSTNSTQSINIFDVVKLNKNLIKPEYGVNYVLVKLLVTSNDQNIKGAIAVYLSNYLNNNLRGDTSEKRYDELEKYYNFVINE